MQEAVLKTAISSGMKISWMLRVVLYSGNEVCCSVARTVIFFVLRLVAIPGGG
jgi:hypothetical protein